MPRIDSADDLLDAVALPLPEAVRSDLDGLVRAVAAEDDAIDCSQVDDPDGIAEIRERWADEMNALGPSEQLTYLAFQGVDLATLARLLAPAARSRHARIAMISMARK